MVGSFRRRYEREGVNFPYAKINVDGAVILPDKRQSKRFWRKAMARVTIHEMPAATAADYPPCTEFYVYAGSRLVRVCPSRGMAESVAAGYR